MARKLYPIDGAGVSQQQFTNTVIYSPANLTGYNSFTVTPTEVSRSSAGSYISLLTFSTNPYYLGLYVGAHISVSASSSAVVYAMNSTKVVMYEVSGFAASVPLANQALTVYSVPGTVQSFAHRYPGSWTVPAGVTRAKVTCIGGGGGGGAASTSSGGVGGGGGGTVVKTYTNLVPGTTYNFIVGHGGQGGGYMVSGIGMQSRISDTSYRGTGVAPAETSLTNTFNVSWLANSNNYYGPGYTGGNTIFIGPTTLYAFGGQGGNGVWSSTSTFNYQTVYNSDSYQQGGAYGGDLNILGQTAYSSAGNGDTYKQFAIGSAGGASALGFGGGSASVIGALVGQHGSGYGGGGGGAACSFNGGISYNRGGNGYPGAIIIEY